jgi:O-antigen/teichoic acid export membrane protein
VSRPPLDSTAAPSAPADREDGPVESGGLSIRLAKNSLVQIVGTVVASTIGFVTFIVVARALGPSIYGDVTAANVYLYIPTVLAEVGLSMVVVREISADESTTEDVIGGSLPLRLVIGVATVTVAVAVAFLLPFNHRTTLAIVVGAPGALFTIMTLSVQPVLQARLKMQWAVAATLVGRLATLALTILAVTGDLGYLAVVAATVVGLGITFALSVVFVRRLIQIRLRLDLSLWRRLIGPALYLAVAVGSASLIARVDTILISLLKPSRDVGLYGAAYKFLDVSTLFASAVGISLFPVFSRLLVVDPARARRILQKSLDVMLAVGPAIVVLGIALAPQLIRYSAGDEFNDAVPILQLLLPSLLAVFLQAPLIRFQIAAGSYRLLAGIFLVMLLVNFALNMILIPEYGIRAAAIVNVSTELLGFALQLVFAWTRLRFRPRLGYVPAVAGATALMIGALFALGDVPVAAALTGAVLYLGVLLWAPGVIRELARNAFATVRT